MTRWLLIAGLTGLAALSGCAAPPPPPPPPTVVNLTLTTGADVNPTPDNQPAPLALRVYQLTSSANFNAAEFFPLYNADAATLKADLAHRQDFLLAPGQTQTLTIKPDITVKSIAILAAYRDFQHATWRAATDIEANKTTDIVVTAGHDGVTLSATVEAPAAAPSSSMLPKLPDLPSLPSLPSIPSIPSLPSAPAKPAAPAAPAAPAIKPAS